jgi:hypothetical protein
MTAVQVAYKPGVTCLFSLVTQTLAELDAGAQPFRSLACV